MAPTPGSENKRGDSDSYKESLFPLYNLGLGKEAQDKSEAWAKTPSLTDLHKPKPVEHRGVSDLWKSVEVQSQIIPGRTEYCPVSRAPLIW